MEDSYLQTFRSLLLHPRRFCKNNDDWNGTGFFLKFGVSMLLLSVAIQLFRIATTGLIRQIDILVVLYSIFLYNLLLPLTVFTVSAAVLQLSLHMFGEHGLQETLAALEASSVVLVIWSIIEFILVRAPTNFTIIIFSTFLTVLYGSYIFFNAFQNAHELDNWKTVLILGTPIILAVFLLSLKPDLLNLLDLIHDTAWRAPTYFSYTN